MAFLKGSCFSLTLKNRTIVIGIISITLFFIFLTLQSEFKTFRTEDVKLSCVFSDDFIVLCGLITFVLAVTAIFLLIGALRGYKVFLLPWIVIFCLFMILYTSFMIHTMVKLSGSVTGGIMAALVIVFLGFLGVEIYMLAVVISLFEELRRSTTMGGNNPGKIWSGPNYGSSGGVYMVSSSAVG